MKICVFMAKNIYLGYKSKRNLPSLAKPAFIRQKFILN